MFIDVFISSSISGQFVPRGMYNYSSVDEDYKLSR
jgi:hypothetical protein